MKKPHKAPKKNKGGRPRKQIDDTQLFSVGKKATVDDIPLFLKRKLEQSEPIIFGYVRVSTTKKKMDSEGMSSYVQTFGSQLQAIQPYQADPRLIFCDRKSGIKERHSLFLLDKIIRPGDTLVVFKLDRLGRSGGEIVNRVQSYNERGITVKVLSPEIELADKSMNTTMFLFMYSLFAEIERENIRERVLAGQAWARENNRRLGRKRKVSDMDVTTIMRLHKDGKSYGQIRALINSGRENKISRTTVQNVVERFRKPAEEVVIPEFALDGGDLSEQDRELFPKAD